MKVPVLAILLASSTAWAFPPAPSYNLYGAIRNEGGRPLATGEGVVIVSGPQREVTRSPVDVGRGRGVNYSVHLPMDAGSGSGLYQVSALRPALPFTIRVEIRGRSYVPIQMSAQSFATGRPGERVRLDLTLGEDSDRDGLPDSWEQALIDHDAGGRLRTLADVNPHDDLDGDGLSNLQEFHLGTYALSRLEGLGLEILEVSGGRARLRFAAVKGRTYHIRSSSDLKGWREEGFALEAAAPVQRYLIAADTRLMDVFVPLGPGAGRSFRLHAE